MWEKNKIDDQLLAGAKLFANINAGNRKVQAHEPQSLIPGSRP